ncbi:MAG: hypothetical protein M1823_004241 [Watsoniomyces obsoletus]|nr:MAG: hypothetical protein M1823_004241 [Watsoniomyces obsoletus]
MLIPPSGSYYLYHYRKDRWFHDWVLPFVLPILVLEYVALYRIRIGTNRNDWIIVSEIARQLATGVLIGCMLGWYYQAMFKNRTLRIIICVITAFDMAGRVVVFILLMVLVTCDPVPVATHCYVFKPFVYLSAGFESVAQTFILILDIYLGSLQWPSRGKKVQFLLSSILSGVLVIALSITTAWARSASPHYPYAYLFQLVAYTIAFIMLGTAKDLWPLALQLLKAVEERSERLSLGPLVRSRPGSRSRSGSGSGSDSAGGEPPVPPLPQFPLPPNYSSVDTKYWMRGQGVHEEVVDDIGRVA